MSVDAVKLHNVLCKEKKKKKEKGKRRIFFGGRIYRGTVRDEWIADAGHCVSIIRVGGDRFWVATQPMPATP